MKIYTVLFVIFLVVGTIPAFTQNTFIYSYDASGNRIKREIFYPPKRTNQDTTNAQTAQIDSIVQDKSHKFTDSFGKGTVSVYPNPTLGALQIDFTGEMPDGEVLLNVYDLSGRTVVKQRAQSSNNIVNLSEAKPGEYLLKITSPEKTLEWSIIKQ